jgi:hypothetical protein
LLSTTLKQFHAHCFPSRDPRINWTVPKRSTPFLRAILDD